MTVDLNYNLLLRLDLDLQYEMRINHKHFYSIHFFIICSTTDFLNLVFRIMKGMFIYFIKLKQKVIITNFTFLSRRNVGLKLEYQLWEDYITAKSEYSEKLNNNEDDELPAKKLKLNDNKRITNLEYSVKLPVAPFIDYLEKYSNTFVDRCLKYNNSN